MADLRVDHVDWLLTLDAERRIIRDGAVAVEGGGIVGVGKSEQVAAAHPARRVISGRGKVVTPGLIDSHIRTTFQMSRGLADEVGSRKFLFERMYPYEGALDEQDAPKTSTRSERARSPRSCSAFSAVTSMACPGTGTTWRREPSSGKSPRRTQTEHAANAATPTSG